MIKLSLVGNEAITITTVSHAAVKKTELLGRHCSKYSASGFFI